MGVNRPRTSIQADALARRVERAGGSVERLAPCVDGDYWYVIARDRHGKLFSLLSHWTWRNLIYPEWNYEASRECPYCAASNCIITWGGRLLQIRCADCGNAWGEENPGLRAMQAQVSHVP